MKTAYLVETIAQHAMRTASIYPYPYNGASRDWVAGPADSINGRIIMSYNLGDWVEVRNETERGVIVGLDIEAGTATVQWSTGRLGCCVLESLILKKRNK